MNFAYGESFTESSPEAYERLILREPWKILGPIEKYGTAHGKPAQYPSGTWGPKEADEMLARDGRSWRRP